MVIQWNTPSRWRVVVAAVFVGFVVLGFGVRVVASILFPCECPWWIPNAVCEALWLCL